MRKGLKISVPWGTQAIASSNFDEILWTERVPTSIFQVGVHSVFIFYKYLRNYIQQILKKVCIIVLYISSQS